MRFLVDLYRGLILLGLAVLLIAGAAGGFWFAFGPLAATSAKWVYLAVATGIAIFVILALGIMATFISIHDRIADMASQSKRIADALDRSTPYHS